MLAERAVTLLSAPEKVGKTRQWLSSRIDLDRVLMDTVRVTPNGVEQVQTVHHRLGDYFAATRLLPDAQASSAFSTDSRRPGGSGKT